MIALALLLAAAPPCASGSFEITVDGAKRGYELRVPASVPAPAVFTWHGWGGSAKNMLRGYQGRLPAAVVVAPHGLPRQFPGLGKTSRPGWQIREDDLGGRDLAFFDALLGKLVADGCVDAGRVVSTGFSNGSFFTNVLGCARADKLVAVAAVGGGGPGSSAPGKCGPAVPALVVHGTEDRVVEFARGEASLDHYRQRNSCEKVKFTRGCHALQGCAVTTEACAFKGGHVFPRRMRDKVSSFLEAHLRAP